MRRSGLENAADLLRELLDAKRFCHVGQVVALQKIARMRGENVSGDKQKTLAKWIFVAGQRLVERFLRTGRVDRKCRKKRGDVRTN